MLWVKNNSLGILKLTLRCAHIALCTTVYSITLLCVISNPMKNIDKKWFFFSSLFSERKKTVYWRVNDDEQNKRYKLKSKHQHQHQHCIRLHRKYSHAFRFDYILQCVGKCFLPCTRTWSNDHTICLILCAAFNNKLKLTLNMVNGDNDGWCANVNCRQEDETHTHTHTGEHSLIITKMHFTVTEATNNWLLYILLFCFVFFFWRWRC